MAALLLILMIPLQLMAGLPGSYTAQPTNKNAPCGAILGRLARMETVLDKLQKAMDTLIDNQDVEKQYLMKRQAAIEKKVEWSLAAALQGKYSAVNELTLFLASKVLVSGTANDTTNDFRSLGRIHTHDTPTLYKDCLEAKRHGWIWSGLYQISPNASTVLDVYCEQVAAGGGWSFQLDYMNLLDFRPFPDTSTLPKVYKDCLEAKRHGWIWSGLYKISPNATTVMDVYCEHAAGGSWTLLPDHKLIKDFRPIPDTRTPALPKDCREASENGWTSPGIYKISPDSQHGIDVYCDEGGWTVIQRRQGRPRRQSGQVDFDEDWKTYKEGFGDVGGSFWLGNDNINLLTRGSQHTLQMYTYFWDAYFYNVTIDDESQNYRLHITKPDPENLMHAALMDRAIFSTKDKENGVSCRTSYDVGGWWMSDQHCTSSVMRAILINHHYGMTAPFEWIFLNSPILTHYMTVMRSHCTMRVRRN